MRGSPLALMCLLIAGPAAAQADPVAAASERPAATRSVDDYLCAFAGKCEADAGDEPTLDAPATKGFRLARPTAGDAPAPRETRSTAPRQRRASISPKARASASRPATRVASVGRSRRASAAFAPAALAAAASTAAASTAPAAEIRADLRLSFELGSDRLTPQAMEEARVFAQSLIRPELAGKRFLIEGHTDAVGGRSYNLDLSRRRARAVADHLATLGVSRDRLDVRGFGFDRPVSGRRSTSPINRRVEAVLVS